MKKKFYFYNAKNPISSVCNFIADQTYNRGIRFLPGNRFGGEGVL